MQPNYHRYAVRGFLVSENIGHMEFENEQIDCLSDYYRFDRLCGIIYNAGV